MIAFGRATRGWAQLALHVALLLVGLGLLQVVAERTNRRFDLTPTGALSLSQVTRGILAQVEAPLRVTVFHRRGERERYAELAERFGAENARIAVELLDLDRHPERAQALGVSQYGRAALEYEGRRHVGLAFPEEELAGGVLQVVRGQRRRMLFTTGHGERAPGGDPQSYGRLAAALERENYAPESVSLLAGDLPAEPVLVVVAGPRHDFLLPELDALAAHLKRGGGVLLLLDPAPLPNLARFLDTMGIRVADDFLVDRERRVLNTDGLAAVVELFKRGNPISDSAASPIESGVVLPSARSVDVVREAPGVRVESIARTADSGWAMADPDRARRGETPSRAAGDAPGAASVMVMGEVGGGRLVVVGDADFASDAYLDVLGNRDLALNAVAWVAGERALAGVRNARVPEVMRPLSPLVLTEPQANGLFLATVVAEPALVLLVGLAVVGLRRRAG